MPPTYHPNVIQRARELWTREGVSPEENVEQLSYELTERELEWTLNLPDSTRLPGDRSTINRLAKRHQWAPHWKYAKKLRVASQDSTKPFSVSGIDDPIWHLSKTLAFTRACEYAHDSNFRSEPVDAVMMQIQMDVAYSYNPPPTVFRMLRPGLRQRIRQEKKKAKEMEELVSTSDGTLIEMPSDEGGDED